MMFNVDSTILTIVTVILGALGGVGFLIHKIGRYQQKIDDLKDDHKGIVSEFKTLKTDIDSFKEFKVHVQKFIDAKLYSSSSPLKLSKLGQKLVEESGFLDIFENVKEDLANKLQTKSPKTKYDVQEKARELMDSLTSYPQFLPIETYAFKVGEDFQQILRAGAT